MSSYVRRKTPGDTEWFVHDRFGMFIHWGIYAMPARGEWVRSIEKIPAEEYERKYFAHFDPDLYDPREWARQAKAAGMKYAVLTTKHHDGFCLFDTAYTDFKATNTPAGRDLVREYVDAFRAEGLKIGFYYSLIDWHHPDFIIDRIHPLCKTPDVPAQNAVRDMRRYDEYMRNQVTELLTNYGKIDILWFDFTLADKPDEKEEWLRRGKRPEDWEADKLIALARSLQPWLIIDNRSGIEQDLFTPEQYQVTDWVRHPVTGEYVTWEACQTFSGSWGYHRDEMTWKTPQMLVEMLVNTVSCGGNLLMNVGPTARGTIDARATAALGAYAEWMKANSRSVYGCTMAEPELLATCPSGCRYTQSEDGKRLYVHLFDFPYKFLEIPGLADRVEYAQFLHDGSEVRIGHTAFDAGVDGVASSENLLSLRLPYVKPDVVVPVIELFLKEKDS